MFFMRRILTILMFCSTIFILFMFLSFEYQFYGTVFPKFSKLLSTSQFFHIMCSLLICLLSKCGPSLPESFYSVSYIYCRLLFNSFTSLTFKSLFLLNCFCFFNKYLMLSVSMKPTLFTETHNSVM